MPTLLRSLFCFLILMNAAHAVPDLSSQGKWGNGEKKQFLKYLRSGKQMPIKGEVRSVSEPSYTGVSSSKKPLYLSASFLTNTMFLEGRDKVRRAVSSNLGGRFVFGGHLFSWVRYYTGVQYTAIDQKRRDGRDARLNHYQIPVGLELALIPLGTPHTRYVLLRGGISAHYVEGNANDEDFDTSLLGVRGSYNLGLGYEWQISNTRWRINGLVEGMRSISREKGSKFSGAGVTLGAVYTI